MFDFNSHQSPRGLGQTSILRILVTVLATALCFVLLTTSKAKADEMGSFDERGNYNFHQYSPPSSMRPSIGQDGYSEAYRREQQQQERQYFQDQQQERRNYSTPAVPPSVSGSPDTWSQFGKHGDYQVCSRGHNGSVFCQ